MRITITDIRNRKDGEPLVALTSYHAHTAEIVDRYAEIILVGDSLGMVMHGMKNTLTVPMKLMKMHGEAVVRGSQRALVVVDMPFGSYEESPAIAFRNAVKLLKDTGCGAVKLEGGARMANTIRFLVERGVPVMAHIGLTPQTVLTMGGFKAQGLDTNSWPRLLHDAEQVAEAGAFAVVLEGIVAPLAREITAKIPIPTIGIGAAPECDGQILVLEDILGLNPKPAKFVKVYGEVGAAIEQAVAEYASDVRARRFPTGQHCYQPGKKR